MKTGATRSNGRTYSRGRFTKTFIVSLLAGALAAGGVGAAHAVTDSTGYVTNPQNEVIHHDVPRYNSYVQNLVAWKPTSDTCNNEMILAVRDPGGTQIARGPSHYFNMGIWVTMRKPNGSSQIPRGTFYLNSLMTHFSGNGSYQGPCTWSADIMYNELNI